jgi:hypothetical protein
VVADKGERAQRGRGPGDQPGRGPGDQPDLRGQPGRDLRRLAATVLGFEALVVVFAALVASQLSRLGMGLALGVGAVLALICLVLAGLLRFRWAYWLGSLLQLVLVATGFVVPAMFFLGAVFAVLWVVALRMGTRMRADNA